MDATRFFDYQGRPATCSPHRHAHAPCRHALHITLHDLPHPLLAGTTSTTITVYDNRRLIGLSAELGFLNVTYVGAPQAWIVTKWVLGTMPSFSPNA